MLKETCLVTFHEQFWALRSHDAVSWKSLSSVEGVIEMWPPSTTPDLHIERISMEPSLYYTSLDFARLYTLRALQNQEQFAARSRKQQTICVSIHMYLSPSSALINNARADLSVILNGI